MPHLLRVYITRPRGEPSKSKGWLGAATRRLCRARQPCWGWLEHRRPAGRALVGAGASACALSSFRCMYQIVRGYPRSYLGCTVELDSHLGCSGAPKLVYIHVVQASGCVVIVRKSPHHPLAVFLHPVQPFLMSSLPYPNQNHNWSPVNEPLS